MLKTSFLLAALAIVAHSVPSRQKGKTETDNQKDVEVMVVDFELLCPIFEGMTTSKDLCEPDFWQCKNGKVVRQTCSKGLVYDDEHHWCDYPGRVKGCEGFEEISKDFATTNMDETAGQPAAKKQLVGEPAPAPEPSTPTYSMNEEKKENFECHDKEDGSYGMGYCLPLFANCSGGKLRVIECNDGLLFDTRISECSDPDACKTDLKKQSVPQQFKHEWETETVNQKNVEMKPAELEFLCSGFLFEGMSTSKQLCEPDFWQCKNGKVVRQTCPEGLMYDDEHHWCDYPGRVKGCENVNELSS